MNTTLVLKFCIHLLLLVVSINRFNFQDNAPNNVVDGIGESIAGLVPDALLVSEVGHTCADISVAGPGPLLRALRLSPNDCVTGLSFRGEDFDGCGFSFWLKLETLNDCTIFQNPNGVSCIRVVDGNLILEDDNSHTVTLALPGITLTNWNHFGFITYPPAVGDSMLLEFYANSVLIGGVIDAGAFEATDSWRFETAGKISNGTSIYLAGIAFNQYPDLPWTAATIASNYVYSIRSPFRGPVRVPFAPNSK